MANRNRATRRSNRKIGRRGTARPNRSLGANDPSIARNAAADRGGNYEWPLQVRATRERAGVVELVTTMKIDKDLGLVPGAQADPLDVMNLLRNGVEVGHQSIGLHVDARTGTYWNTASGALEEFPRGGDEFRWLLDLRRYDEVRFHFYANGGGGTGAVLQLAYHSTATGTLVAIDVDATQLAFATAVGEVDSGWHDLVEGAQIAGAYVGILQDNVSSASRHVYQVTAEFRAKEAA